MLVRKGKKIVEKKNDRQRTSRNKERKCQWKKERDHGKRKLPKPFIPALMIWLSGCLCDVCKYLSNL